MKLRHIKNGVLILGISTALAWGGAALPTSFVANGGTVTLAANQDIRNVLGGGTMTVSGGTVNLTGSLTGYTAPTSMSVVPGVGGGGTLIIGGNGDVIEPDEGVAAIGSGGPFAKAAAVALMDNTDLNARAIAEKAMAIASKICIYTNDSVTYEELG